MFELADFLVGIYKVEDCTQSLTIHNFDKQRVLGFGEKETEKENISENSLLSPTVSKGGKSPLNENLTQAMDTDDNDALNLQANGSQRVDTTLLSPPTSQPVM